MYTEGDWTGTLWQVESGNRIVADCVLETARQPGMTRNEKIANIKLISAAPNLAEALKAYQTANRLHNDSEAELYQQGEMALKKAGVL